MAQQNALGAPRRLGTVKANRGFYWLLLQKNRRARKAAMEEAAASVMPTGAVQQGDGSYFAQGDGTVFQNP